MGVIIFFCLVRSLSPLLCFTFNSFHPFDTFMTIPWSLLNIVNPYPVYTYLLGFGVSRLSSSSPATHNYFAMLARHARTLSHRLPPMARIQRLAPLCRSLVTIVPSRARATATPRVFASHFHSSRAVSGACQVASAFVSTFCEMTKCVV